MISWLRERKPISVRSRRGFFESEWEIVLKNHKAEDITVNIIEPIYGNWEITGNSHPYRKVDAFTVRFDIPVAKDGEVTVSYRARLGI